jgi:hypothetical protein
MNADEHGSLLEPTCSASNVGTRLFGHQHTYRVSVFIRGKAFHCSKSR